MALVSNAIKFTEHGGVTVEVGKSEPGPDALPNEHGTAAVSVRFAVADTGIGLTPEQLSAIFEPFRQVDGSHTRRVGGAGLGLAIARKTVEAMIGAMPTTDKRDKKADSVTKTRPVPSTAGSVMSMGLPDVRFGQDRFQSGPIRSFGRSLRDLGQGGKGPGIEHESRTRAGQSQQQATPGPIGQHAYDPAAAQMLAQPHGLGPSLGAGGQEGVVEFLALGGVEPGQTGSQIAHPGDITRPFGDGDGPPGLEHDNEQFQWTRQGDLQRVSRFEISSAVRWT